MIPAVRNYKIRKYKRILERLKKTRLDKEFNEEDHPRTMEKGHEGEFTTKGNKESVLTQDDKKRDKDYRDALKRGDTEEAQRLVREAAKKAGYSLRAFHGTPNQFTSFNMGDEGIHLGTKEQAEQIAEQKTPHTVVKKWSEARKMIEGMSPETRRNLIQEAYNLSRYSGGINRRMKPPDSVDEEDPEDVDDYVDKVLSRCAEHEGIDKNDIYMTVSKRNPGEDLTVMDLYTAMKNPFVIDVDIIRWSTDNIADLMLETKDGKYFDEFQGKHVSISPFKLSDDDKKTLESIVEKKWNPLKERNTDEEWSQIRAILKRCGYDGIKYKNEVEGNKTSYSYIALSPNDVKSADTIVRDEDGDIIPLSQRFSTSSNDIRGHGNISNKKEENRPKYKNR